MGREGGLFTIEIAEEDRPQKVSNTRINPAWSLVPPPFPVSN